MARSATFTRLGLVCALLGIARSAAIAQTPASQPGDAVPLDPQVRRGKLSNGFEYYIRRNVDPKAEVEMRLVVNAGRLHEDDDQFGLAHLLEHMAFNGTTHYPNNTLREYFDQAGLVPGYNWNARTGRATDYRLRLPTDKPALYESGFQIMRDWAQGLTLDSAQIDGERGVVVGESRGGEDASFKMQLEMAAKLLRHPKYPLNSREKHDHSIRSFTHETLRRFYRDWYRPDLEALVVVGDVDVDQVEQRIVSLFADLTMPADPRPAPDITAAYDVTLTGKNQFLVLSGDHMSSTTVHIYVKRKAELPAIRTVRDYRQAIMDKLYNAMMKARLAGLSRRYNVPFQVFYHRMDRGALQPMAGLDALHTYLEFTESQPIGAGIRTAVAELERVRQHGFLASELTRAKASVLKELAEQRRTTSTDLVRRLVAHYAEGAAAPDLEYERDLQRRLIEEIELPVINNMAREWLGANADRDVVIMAPTSAVSRLPTERDIEAWFDESRGGKIAAYVEPEPPIEQLMSAVEIAKLRYDTSYTVVRSEELGITELRLHNGIKVVLRPFEPEDGGDKVMFHGFSAGGHGAYGDDAFLARRAIHIVRNAGVGRIDKFALNEFLAEKGVAVGLELGRDAANINVLSTPAELETVLQVVHLYLTAPRRDSGAFEDWRTSELAELERAGVSADNGFRRVIDTTRYRDRLANTRPTRQEIERLREADAYRLYQDRFTRPGDFTFILAGDFEAEKALPLLLRYLGSLPATKAKKPSRSSERLVARMGKASTTVYRGSDEKAEVQLFFSGRYIPSLMAKLKLDVLAQALQMRMHERLREQEGGTYIVNSWVDHRQTSDTYAFAVSFTAAIDQVEHLIGAAVEEVELLRTAGLEPALFEGAVARARDNLSSRLRSVDFWTSYLADRYMRQEDPTEILKPQTILTDIVTNEAMNDAARAFFGTENMMRFVLLPARQAPKPARQPRVRP